MRILINKELTAEKNDFIMRAKIIIYNINPTIILF